MRNTLLAYIERFRHDRRERAMLGSVLVVLAVVVTLLVYWQLRGTGITMTNETYCGYEEHVHTEECYEYTLICELEETGHVHDESCYEEQQVLVCTIEESEGHMHGETCYDEEGNLICGLSESTGHTHDESCYETQQVLVCGLEETPDAHIHTDECYEKTLICELEEHTHTIECMINLNADLEDYTIWEATLPELTGDLRTDVVNIAYSQLGYTESTANYSVGEDETIHYGYTRYGAWYGNSYADWDSMFVAFCLDYAGISEEFTYNAGAYAWSVDLTNLGYYQTADAYEPSIGDVVFIDTDDDGKANTTAIVVAVDETTSTITVIQGNYTVTDSDDNTTDTVALVTYSTVVETEETIAESEIVTLSTEPEAETNSESEAEEIAPAILGYANISPEADSEEDIVLDEDGEELTEETAEEDGETNEAEDDVSSFLSDLTCSCGDYTITITYGEDAGLPDGTYLEAYEYSNDSETYLLRYAEAAAIYGWEGEPTDDFHVFNIGLYYEGVEIEPAAEVQVSITYTADENSGNVSVTHHDETAEPLYAVSEYSEETGTETVTFTTDGFSDYSIMAASDDDEEDNSSSDDNSLTASSPGTTYLYDSDGDEIENSVVTWSYVSNTASYSDGELTVGLRVDFSVSADSVSASETYVINLPEDVSVPDSVLNTTYTGKDDKGETAFTYKYVYDATTGTYSIEVTYLSDYLTKLDSETTDLNCYISYSYYDYDYSDEDLGDEGVTIKYGDNAEIIISYDEIDSDDNESLYQDLTVTKSASNYDSDSNSITYTVYISSQTGTGVITLKDLLTIATNNSIYSAASIENITLDSVIYQLYERTYGYEWDGVIYYNYSWVSGGSTTESDSESISGNTDPGYYTSYTYEDGDTGLTITLSPLEGAYTTESGNVYTSDQYVITYTVTFDDSYAFESTVINDATATSTIGEDTVTDDATKRITVSSSMVDKSGESNNETSTITYTIIFNEGNANITGYKLFDEMLSSATEITVYYLGDDGNYSEASSDDYTVDEENGTITFNAVNEDDTNTRTYKVVYTVDKGLSGFDNTTYYYNTVKVYDGDGDQVDEGSDTEYVSPTGSVDKELTEASDDYESSTDGSGNTTYTRELSWTSTINIPSAGMSSGTEITDYLGKWSNDNSSYTYGASSVYQWFTYDQITEFFKELAENGIKFIDASSGKESSISYTYTDDDGNTQYNFTLEAYDPDSKTWVDYSVLTNDESDYKDTLFTAYRITMNTYVGEGQIVLEYSTTADITSVIDNTSSKQTYYNVVYVGSKSDYAEYTEYDTVYKTDGNGNIGSTSTSATTNDDGTVTWKVNVLIPDEADEDSGTFVITDTLPSGVTLETLTLSIDGRTVTFTQDTSNEGTYTATINNTEVTATVTKGEGETTIVEVSIPYGAYSSMVGYNGYYMTLTLTCSIDGWDTWYNENTASGDTNSYTFNNSVSVKWGNDDYGSDEQEQTITVTYEEEADETTHDVVEKSVDASGVGSKDNSTNELIYTVLLNLDGATLNSGEDLEFVDTLTYYYFSYMTIDLESNSVAFYELVKMTLSSSDTYSCTYTNSTGNEVVVSISASDISSDSNVYAYEESDGYTYYYKVPLSISWDYSTDDSEGWRLYCYITASIPDETAILVTYTYYIVDADYVYIVNSATLTGESGTDGSDNDEVDDQYYEDAHGAGVYSSGGYTLIKSGEHTSDFLEGAVFQLYVYDNTDGSDTYGTFIPAEYSSDEISKYSLVEGVNYITGTDSSGDEHYYVIYTTNASGVISVVPYAEGSSSDDYVYWEWYETDLVYYLVEIEAPTGYILDGDTKYYFYWASVEDGVVSTANPDGYTYGMDVQNLSSDASSNYVSNAPITTFTLKKIVNGSDGTTLSGAEFYLYEYLGDDSSGDAVWKYLGSYTTDSNGEINITFDASVYSLDTAYMLREVAAPDGYTAGYGDYISFYFYWDEDDPDTEGQYPSGWGTAEDDDGYSYATAANIASANTTVEATNTKTSTSVSVTKVWLDANGNEVTNSSSSATVQLRYYVTTEAPSSSSGSSSSSANYETVTLASVDVSGTIPSGNSITWGTMTSNKNVQSNLFDYLVSGTYLQVSVEKAASISDLTIYLQTESNGSYPVIATLSVPTDSVYNSDGTWTLYYSYDYIVSQLEKNGYDIDDISGFYIMNGSSGGTITNFSVVSYYEVADTYSSSISLSGSWASGTYNILNSSADVGYISTDGAVIRIKYSITEVSSGSSNQIQVGIVCGGSTVYKYYSVVVTDGVAELLIPVSDFGIADLSNYQQIQINSTGVTGTISSIEILVPYTSSSSGSSTTTTTTETLLTLTSTEGTLTSSWWSNSANILASYTGTEVTYYTLKTLLQSNTDAYIELVVSGSSSLNLLIQYNMTSTDGGYPTESVSGTYTVDSDGNYVYKFLASDILSTIENSSYSDDYQLLISGLSGDNTATLVSAAVKVDTETSMSSTTVDADYYVTLYTWTPSGSETSTDNDGNTGYITSLTSSTTSYYWNVISTWEDDYANIRGLLDAIYGNLTSRVYVTLTDVNEATAAVLDKLELIIQGDTSVGDQGYGTILEISPLMIIHNEDVDEDDSYTLVYRSSQIVTFLSQAEAKYEDAASVYADYLKLILSFSTYGDYSATLKSIVVRTTDQISLSSTYAENYLVGSSTTSYVYSDENTPGTYTLNSSNNWTVTVSGLPMSYTVTDDSGNITTYYYYYYFVETGYSGVSSAYTTTYSQTEGENTGGEIVITNVETTYILPSAGGTGMKTLYEFGITLILLATTVACAYRNISRLRESLVTDPLSEKVSHKEGNRRLPDQRNRKFVNHRIVRKGDTRAGPDEGG